MDKKIKYCIIGAGGTGGCLAAFMARAGKDVTVIARGENLRAIQENGLYVRKNDFGSFAVTQVKAQDMEHYEECPDVIFVCVKGYSLADTIPFIRRIAGENTIVIPILNIYGTGEKMQQDLPGILVTDGCIYIAAELEKPGRLWMNGDIFRVVYGVRSPEQLRPELFYVARDLKESNIEAILSENIRRDALQKFAYVSPMAAAGLYFDKSAEAFQVTGDPRDTFVLLMQEIDALAQAMEIPFQIDIVHNNLVILDTLSPTASTSMQRDIAAGKPSEIDGLIYEVIRLGEKLKVPTPTYRRIAKAIEERLK